MPYTWGDTGIGEAAGLPRRYETALSPVEVPLYQAWKTQYAPADSGDDYDFPGAYKAGLTPDPATAHWPDTYKKPNHPTFSNESIYATGEDAAKAGRWDGETFVPPAQPATAAPAARVVWGDEGITLGGSVGDGAPATTPPPAGRADRRLELQRKLRKQGQPYHVGPGGEIQIDPGSGKPGMLEQATDAVGAGIGAAGDVGGFAMNAPLDFPRFLREEWDPPPSVRAAAGIAGDVLASKPVSGVGGALLPYYTSDDVRGLGEHLQDYQDAVRQPGPVPGTSAWYREHFDEQDRPIEPPDKRTYLEQAAQGALGAMSAPFPLVGQTITGAFAEPAEHSGASLGERLLDIPIGAAKGFKRGVAQAGERVAPAVRFAADVNDYAVPTPGGPFLSDYVPSDAQIRGAYGEDASGGTRLAREFGWSPEAGAGIDLGAELLGGYGAERGPRALRNAYELGLNPAKTLRPDFLDEPPGPPPPPPPPPPGPPLPPRAYPLEPVGRGDYAPAVPPSLPGLDVAPVPPELLDRPPAPGGPFPVDPFEYPATARFAREEMPGWYEDVPPYGTEGFEMRPGTSEPPPTREAILRARARIGLERQGEPWGHTMMPPPERGGGPVRGGLRFDPGALPEAVGSSELPPVRRGAPGPGMEFEHQGLPDWLERSMRGEGKDPGRMLNDVDLTEGDQRTTALAVDPLVEALRRRNPALAERAARGDIRPDELLGALTAHEIAGGLRVPLEPPDLGRAAMHGDFPDAPHDQPVLIGEHVGKDGRPLPIYQESLDVSRGGRGEQRVLTDGVRATLSGYDGEFSPTGGAVYELTGLYPKEGANLKEPGKAIPVIDAARRLAREKGADLISDTTAMSPSMILTWEREVAAGRATWDRNAGVYRMLPEGEQAMSGYHPSIRRMAEEGSGAEPFPHNLENITESADEWTRSGMSYDEAQDSIRKIVEARHPEWARDEPNARTAGSPDAGSQPGDVRPTGGATPEGTGRGALPPGPDSGVPGRVPPGSDRLRPGDAGGGAPPGGGDASTSVADVWPDDRPPAGFKPLADLTATRQARKTFGSVTPLADKIIDRGGMRVEGMGPKGKDVALDFYDLSRTGGRYTKIVSTNPKANPVDVMATDLGFADESALLDALQREQRASVSVRKSQVEQMQSDHLERAREAARTKSPADLVGDLAKESQAKGQAKLRKTKGRKDERGAVVSRGRDYTPAEVAELEANAMAAREEIVKRYKTVDAAAKAILTHSPSLGAARARRIAQATFDAVPPEGATGPLPNPPNVPPTSTGDIPLTGDPAAERVGGDLLSKFAIDGDLKRAAYDLAQSNGDYLGARRNPRTWTETEMGALDVARRQVAKGLGLDPDVLTRNIPLNELPERLLLLRELTVDAGRKFDAALQAFDTDKSPESYARFAQATSQWAGLSEAAAATSSESARALNIMKRTAGDLAQGKRLQEIIKAAGGQGKLDTIATLYKALPENVRPGFLRNAIQATTTGKLYEAWINGILSNPASAAANALSNLSFYALDHLEHGALALVPGTEVSMREFAAGAAAARRAVGPAFKAFAEAFDSESESIGGKFETPHPVAIGGTLGRVVRIPTRTLGATDAGFKALAYLTHIERLATREGLANGLKGGALDRYVDGVRADAISHEPTMVMRNGNKFSDAARAHAEYLTFTQTSELANAFSQFGRRVPGRHLSNVARGAFNVVMPFKRTPINIAKAAIDHSPIGLARELLRRADLVDPATGFETAGARRQLALARAALGSTAMAAIMYEVAQGNISGYGPTSADQRAELYESGWLPYAAKVGDRWVSYSRLEPFASVMGLGADWGETVRDYPASAKDSYLGAMGRMSLALGSQLATKSYLQGPGEILQAFIEHDENKLDRFVTLMGGSVVPASGFLRGAANLYDPVLREEKSILDAWQAKIPGWRQKLKPKRESGTGDPVVRHFVGESIPGVAMLSPFQQSQIKDSPFAKERARLRISIGRPDDSIELANGEKRTLTPDEYDRLSMIGGRLIFESGTNLVTSPEWELKSQDEQKKAIERIRAQGRRQARDVFVSEWGATAPGSRSVNPQGLSQAYDVEQRGRAAER